MSRPFIHTVSGKSVPLLDTLPDHIDIKDIAYALSRINRYTGHTAGNLYTVAHHSVLVAELLSFWGAPDSIVKEGLLHDAGEAYYGDISSPMKRAIAISADENYGPGRPHPLQGVFDSVDHAIQAKFSLSAVEHPLVRRADLVALAIESRDLFVHGPDSLPWNVPEYPPVQAPVALLHISNVPPTKLLPEGLVESKGIQDIFQGYFDNLITKTA